MITLKTTVEIPKIVLSDLLITAVEGGIGYWARGYDYRWSDEHPETTRIVVVEYESAAQDLGLDIWSDWNELDTAHENGDMRLVGYTWGITTHTIECGIQAILNSDFGGCNNLKGRLFADVTNIDHAGWDYDALDADVIVQMGLWGKVIYG